MLAVKPRILEQVAIFLLPDPAIEPASPAMAGGFFTAVPHGKPGHQSYLALVLFNHLFCRYFFIF